MKYTTEIMSYPISGLEKIDLFGLNPYSELNCEFVIVFNLETEEPLINLKVESDFKAIFRKSESFNDLIVIGYGNKFVIYDLKKNTKTFETTFDGYFSSFIIDGEDIFVASECDLYKIHKTGKIEWAAKSLGIDGVIISKITEEEIIGEGENDPPDGWESFVIDRKTGKEK